MMACSDQAKEAALTLTGDDPKDPSLKTRLIAAGEVDDTEIRVRLRWRLAPNLVLVDTPEHGTLRGGLDGGEAAGLRGALGEATESLVELGRVEEQPYSIGHNERIERLYKRSFGLD